MIINTVKNKKAIRIIATYQQLRFRCINLIGDDKVVNFNHECTKDLLYRLTEEQMESIFDINMSEINKKRFGTYISYNENLSEDFIIKYNMYLYMPIIYKRIDLSEETIEFLFDNHCYTQVLEQKNLTVEFIEQVRPKLPFLRILSYNTKVDESVIDFYFDELDKFYLSFRKYSKEFLIKHINELNIGALLINNDLTGIVPESILNEYRNRIEKCGSMSVYRNELYIEKDLSVLKDNKYSIDIISSIEYLTEYLIDKYKDILNMDLVKKYQLEYKE